MTIEFNSRVGAGPTVKVKDIMKELSDNASPLASLTGTESLSNVFKHVESSPIFSRLSGVEGFSKNALAMSLVGVVPREIKDHDAIVTSLKLVSELEKRAGAEGFSNVTRVGDEKIIKATNLALNAQTHTQTAAAEALYRTIPIAYHEEKVDFTIRSAGIGRYITGATSQERASEVRPLFGLLKSGDIFRDETLNVHPVYPSDSADPSFKKFVDASEIAPVEISYPKHDPFGRDKHDTQMLKVPVSVENLLGLCKPPGARGWNTTDEIEAAAVTVRKIKVSGEIDGKAVSFFVNTSAMTNNTFAPTNNGTSSDMRSLNLVIRNYFGSSVLDKDGQPSEAFKAFNDAGFEALVSFTLTGNYNRQTNGFDLASGSATVTGVVDLASDNSQPILVPYIENAAIKALAESFEGKVDGASIQPNVNNVNVSNLGYRIEVYDQKRSLTTRRRSPVSIIFPVSKDDTNSDAVDFAVQNISVSINNNTSSEAFTCAEDHVKNIRSMNGQGVVGNDQGVNALPGQFFVEATIIEREVSLKKLVSIANSYDVFTAVSVGLITEVSDITAALASKSGLAAIGEYGAVNDTRFSLVCHQNLARFFQKVGDVRTVGGWEQVKVVATNFERMIGKAYIVPANDVQSDNEINPLAGIGVNVSREHVAYQGELQRDGGLFNAIVTMPTFRHWSLCPIIGVLNVTDASELIGDDSLLTSLAKLKVYVDENGAGEDTTTDGGNTTDGGDTTDGGTENP